MTDALLAELAHLFSIEAFEADRRPDPEEADRLWDIADELHEMCLDADKEWIDENFGPDRLRGVHIRT